MKEIVNEILREEDTARKIIEKAKTEAEGIITNAKNEAKQYLETAHCDLKVFLIQKQENTEKEFLAEKEKIIKKTEEENINLRKSREKDIPAIAKEIFSQVIRQQE
jgi:vacuolar-type H+-ATPase subunit H